MGNSFSNRTGANHHRRYHNHPPPPPYYYHDHPLQPPHNEYSYTTTPTNPTHHHLVSTLNLYLSPPSLTQPPQINYGDHNFHQNHYYPQHNPPYFSGYQQNRRNPVVRPIRFAPPPIPQPPLPHVEHQSARKVRNDVNVHRDTVRLEVDDHNPNQHLVSFVFDASFDGSFTIRFFAKEEPNCTIIPHLPEAFPPVRIPFQKGTSQKFLQPSGTGTDLRYFSPENLSKPSSEEVYPLVISAETVISVSEEPLVHKQITQASLEKTKDGSFKVTNLKQILWIEGVRYELRELYGIDNSITRGNIASGLENNSDKECVICLTEPKDTAIMPCRHLCLCRNCASELRCQSNKCPICRQPIILLLEIDVEN